MLGQALLLLFFNVGCPGCMGRALPFSLALARRYPGLRIIGLHTSFEKGSDDAPARIQAVVEYFKLPYPVYQDDGDLLTVMQQRERFCNQRFAIGIERSTNKRRRGIGARYAVEGVSGGKMTASTARTKVSTSAIRSAAPCSSKIVNAS